MTKRYRQPIFAQTINVGSGRLDARPDGWFYPRNAAEEAALIAAGALADDLDRPGLPVAVSVDPASFDLLGLGGAPVRVSRPLRKRISARNISAMVNAGTANGAPGWTSHMLLEAPGEFTHVAVILTNLEAADVTGVTCAVAATDSATSKITPAGGGAWVGVTFAGASSVTKAQRLSASQPSITISDKIPLASIRRTDGTLPLVMVREFIPVANGTFSATGALSTGAFAQTGVWQSRQQVDGITTPANFTSTTEGSTVSVGGLIFYGPGRQVTVMGVGDSITAGFAATPQQVNWGFLACQSAGAQWVNQGWNGQTTTQFLARGKAAVTALTPSVAIFTVYSPNDGTPTANLTATAWSNAIDFITHCEAAGVVGILGTAIPRNTYDATADGFRKALNDRVRASGIPYIDFDSVMSDNAIPARIIEGLYADDRHPNSAGHVVMGNAAAAVISALVQSVL